MVTPPIKSSPGAGEFLTLAHALAVLSRSIWSMNTSLKSASISLLKLYQYDNNSDATHQNPTCRARSANPIQAEHYVPRRADSLSTAAKFNCGLRYILMKGLQAWSNMRGSARGERQTFHLRLWISRKYRVVHSCEIRCYRVKLFDKIVEGLSGEPRFGKARCLSFGELKGRWQLSVRLLP